MAKLDIANKIRKTKDKNKVIDDLDKIKCPKCGQLKSINNANFYKNQHSKWFKGYDGYCPYCKDCVKNHLNSDDEGSILEVLRIVDKPYFPEKWLKCLEKYSNDKIRAFGDYIPSITGKGINGSLRVFKDGVTDGTLKFTTNEKGEMEIVNDTVKIYSSEWKGSFTIEELDFLNDMLEDLVIANNLENDKKHKDSAKLSVMNQLMISKKQVLYNSTGNSKYLDEIDKLIKIQKVLDEQNLFSRKSSDDSGNKLTAISKVGAEVEADKYIYKAIPLESEVSSLLDSITYVRKSLDPSTLSEIDEAILESGEIINETE